MPDGGDPVPDSDPMVEMDAGPMVPPPRVVPDVVCEDPGPVSPSTCPDFSVDSPAEFAAVMSADCVGSLTISGQAVTSIPILPEVIEGSFTLINSGVVDTDLPGLVEVRGNFDVTDNPRLERFAPFDLSIVGRRFAFSNNAALETLDFPVLACLRGGGPMFGNPELTTFNAPNLQHVQTLEIRDNPRLATIAWPRLGSVGMTQPDPSRLIWTPRELTFYRLPALTQLSLPAVTQVRARLTLEETGATQMSLPTLTALEGLYVGGNPRLATLAMPLLRDFGPQAGWCPLSGGGLGDQCSPVYYVVENPVAVSPAADSIYEAFCAAEGVSGGAVVAIFDDVSTYDCNPGSCQCVANPR
jgi:hypothetical protein